ncbi:hypothetical protein TMES_18645 [Thalassospira mesophila]|uniref:Uncharacterized protein n=2 Tax=Thalassospira mesophila TaxID=1293891 RepID=A0A1Y2KWN0_9PROT|nr:hypothetical protein TMES_18645 [Thalassospira mesophila]
MAYIFTEAQNPLEVAEREWGKADPIMFTKFTSCIGIMGIKDGKVIGVHLTLMGTEDEWVTNANIDQAVALLDGATNPVVIGQIEIWEDTVPGVYQHLLDTLHPVAIYPKDDGIYGGQNDNGSVKILTAP